MADLTAAEQSIVDRAKKQMGLTHVSFLPTTSPAATSSSTSAPSASTSSSSGSSASGGGTSGSSLLSNLGGLGSLGIGAASLFNRSGNTPQFAPIPQTMIDQISANRAALNDAGNAVTIASNGQNPGLLTDAQARYTVAKDRLDASITAAHDAQVSASAPKPSFLQKNASSLEFAGGAIGGAVAGNSLFGSIQNLMDKGVTFKGILTAGSSFLGLGVAMHLMHAALAIGGVFEWTKNYATPIAGCSGSLVLGAPNVKWYFGVGAFLGLHISKYLYWLTSTEGILAVGGLIVAAAILTDLLHGKPSTAQTSLEDLPVWSTGNVLAIASTAAFLSAGFNIDSAMATSLSGPGMQIPVTDLTNKIFAGQSYSTPLMNSDGSAYTGGIPDNGTPIVVKGADGKNNKILVITPGAIVGGRVMENVKEINLTDGLSFQSPTGVNAAYIPWSVNGKINADAVANTQHMSQLLAACQQGQLDPVSCQHAVTLAASGNKSVKSSTAH